LLNQGDDMSRWDAWVFFLLVVICSPVLSAVTEKVAPKDTSVKFGSFRDAYDAGNKLLKERKFPQAVEAYRQAENLSSVPSAKAQAVNAAGWTLIRAHKWVEARELLRQAVQFDPKNKTALGNLGYAGLKIYQYGLGNDEDLQEAAKALEGCAAIDPAYKAELLESVKTIQSRVEANGTVTPIPAPKAGLSYNDAKVMGDKAQAQGQYDLALQYFKKAEAASVTPKAKGAAANRQGLALLEARRPKEAVAHFERATKADSSEKIFLNNLGLAYWTLYDAGLGDASTLKQAVDAFFRSNGMDASYHGANLRMALAELKETDPEAAKPFDSKKDPVTGEAAPMGSPTIK
jgi:tetratricopeptide (TPR) repeat protein